LSGRVNAMTDYYDELETRSEATRDAALAAVLPTQIARAKRQAPGFAKILADVDPAAVTGRSALATLPVTRKSRLIELQAEMPPFGGLTAAAPDALAHLYLSPGPIADPEGTGCDWWRLARALHAGGFRSGDILHNCFSYHFTPAGLMFDGAARALGCAVFPGGTGNSEDQARAMARFRADGYVGTPDFLKTILDKAAELRLDVSSCRRAVVSGGALFPALRTEYAERGVRVLQCYGTADLGLIAYESGAMEGMSCDEGVVVEIVRPGTGDPVPDGEVGEVVVTTLNPDYPLIRFATGDLSAILPGVSPCGRTAPRIKGWMGRADQTTKVRGMFVHPEQIARVTARHREILKARLVVGSEGGRDAMTLQCAVSGDSSPALAAAIADSLQSECKLRGAVEFADPSDLPNDGKVIDDTRDYR
jgi:phenylacetate-coenzyme A ligase PaaK-like adenylate-forming protein